MSRVNFCWSIITCLSKKLYAVINFLCVLCLTVQIFMIIYMVVGRYIFKSVPIWTEQVALFSLVWFSMLSISIGAKDDRHIRMELIDYLIPKKYLFIFDYFSSVVVLVFSICMIKYGMEFVMLAKGVTMSGMRISESYLYFSLPAGGFCTAYITLYKMIEKAVGKKEGIILW